MGRRKAFLEEAVELLAKEKIHATCRGAMGRPWEGRCALGSSERPPGATRSCSQDELVEAGNFVSCGGLPEAGNFPGCRNCIPLIP